MNMKAIASGRRTTNRYAPRWLPGAFAFVLLWTDCVARAQMGPLSQTLQPVAGSGYARRTADDRAADVVNVKDFGAKGDGVKDDSAALNAALDYVRNRRGEGSGPRGIAPQDRTAKVIIPQGHYKVTSTLNWTNLLSLTVNIECQGCIIDGFTKGTPVIDALGSRWLRVSGLTIWGSDTSTPSIGLQIGHANGASADDHHFTDLTLVGNFSFAALYDFAAETTTFDHLTVWNQMPSPSSLGVVLDGINHWHAASRFVNVSAAVDRRESFNETLFINPSIMTTDGAGAPMWMSATSRTRVVTGYLANTSTACGVILYSNVAWPITQLTMDAHFETGTLSDVFCVDGPPNTKEASIRGLEYMDHYPEAANSIFKVEKNVASVTMRDTNIRLDYFPSGRASVFDNPQLWTVTGRYAEVSGNHWNLPAAQFRGTTDVAGQVTFSGGIRMDARPPATSLVRCEQGQITSDANYLYVCTGLNVWKRVQLANW